MFNCTVTLISVFNPKLIIAFEGWEGDDQGAFMFCDYIASDGVQRVVYCDQHVLHIIMVDALITQHDDVCCDCYTAVSVAS